MVDAEVMAVKAAKEVLAVMARMLTKVVGCSEPVGRMVLTVELVVLVVMVETAETVVTAPSIQAIFPFKHIQTMP
jgi:hypothetical protein